MADDFAYINARIRGMRSALLPRGFIGELAPLGSLDEVLSRLRPTVYGRPLQSALSRRGGIEGIDEGFRESLSSTFARLAGLGTGEAGRLVDIAAGRWETKCLKALLRGKIRQETPDRILAACVPAGIFDEPTLRQLAGLESVGAVLSLLRLWGYGPARPLQRAWSAGRRKPGLQQLEHLLDQAFFDDALPLLESTSGGRGLSAFLRLDIDLTNVLTLLRLLDAGSPAAGSAAFFIRGGRSFSLERRVKLSAGGSVRRALELLPPSPLGGVFTDAIPAYRASGERLSVFERAADLRLFSAASRLARHEPLGAGVALGFLWAKVAEVEELRLVCRARHAGIPAPVLSAELGPPSDHGGPGEG